MTGLERNADVVNLASYAPLFAHTDGWQWTPDLIWVNNLQSYGTANYFVQKLFSLNKGTNTVPALLNGLPLTGQDSLYASAVIDKNTREVIIKLVKRFRSTANKKHFAGWGKKATGQRIGYRVGGQWSYQYEQFENPDNVSPKESVITIKGKQIDLLQRLIPFQ
jgi:alpha-L-arabinofuranosidase